MSRSSSPSHEAGSSFRPAFLFLRADQRRALSALYGYARTVDDIADDEAAAPADKKTSLAAWERRVEAIFSGAGQHGRLEKELAWATRAFSMRKENLLLLLEGVGMDGYKREYRTFEELKYYMYRVASAVGMSCLEIFGWSGDTARAYAENLGYAVQLTNIIRDVFEDARSGRMYLPLEDLEKFACDPRLLKNSVYPDNFIELMMFEAGRARGFYSNARRLAEGTEKKKLLSAFIMAQIYSDLLDKIESRGFRTGGLHTRLNGLEKLAAVYKAWRHCYR
jgi:phytoene synthase